MATDDNEDADDDDDDVDDFYFVLLGFIQSGKPQCPSVLHTSVWIVVDPHSCAPQVPHRPHDG